MKTNQVFVISALLVSAVFFGVLSLFDLPHSAMEWIVSDIVLGAILYFSYLVIAMKRSATQTTLGDAFKASRFFLFAALVVGGIFFGVLFLFDLPKSQMEWVISDVILGLILYFIYLAVVMRRHNTSKNKLHDFSRKVTE